MRLLKNPDRMGVDYCSECNRWVLVVELGDGQWYDDDLRNPYLCLKCAQRVVAMLLDEEARHPVGRARKEQK